MIVVIERTAQKQDIDELKNVLQNENISYRELSGPDYLAFHVFLSNDGEAIVDNLQAYRAVEKIIPLSKPYRKQLARRTQKPINIRGYDATKEPFIIAGPCSIESESQLREIAKAVKASGAHALRGGAFKPRTSPYTFQGMGDKGIHILKKIAEEVDLPCVSEILSVNDVELFKKHVDIIQVGARNMQNYDLLKALSKTDKPIILKRGFASTVEEWLLSAEYLLDGGNENVILCERGIRSFDPSTPHVLDLNGVLLAKTLTNLPIIVDPSHAAGDYRFVTDLSKAAIACGAEGVMVEVHHRPEIAKSDGKQSLKPDKFHDLCQSIQFIYEKNRPQ